MDKFVNQLKIAFASQYAFAIKAQNFHWNVEGIEFSQYHDFYANLYQDIYNSIDPVAENIRKLGEYTPISISELHNFKTIEENTVRVDLIKDQLANLIVDNDKVIESLNKVFALATAANKQGIADFIAGRIDTHDKHGWMLRASAKNIG
jgi:starvation-inducible DNA-binding protein